MFYSLHNSSPEANIKQKRESFISCEIDRLISAKGIAYMNFHTNNYTLNWTKRWSIALWMNDFIFACLVAISTKKNFFLSCPFRIWPLASIKALSWIEFHSNFECTTLHRWVLDRIFQVKTKSGNITNDAPFKWAEEHEKTWQNWKKANERVSTDYNTHV